MPKYSITFQFERTQIIEVEANSKDEAINIVYDEFENHQLTSTEDKYVEVLGATLIED